MLCVCRELTYEQSLLDKDLEKLLVKHSAKEFARKSDSTLQFAREIGNMYTPSLYAGLASHLVK